MHRCSVFKNSCLNVPVDPISKMPKTAYERNERNILEQCSIESIRSCSVSGTDVDAEKFKDFYRSIPDYNDINHLTETEFYTTLKRLRDKKKLMLGLAVEHIDDCNVYNDKLFEKMDKDIYIKNRKMQKRKTSQDRNIDKANLDLDSIGNASKESIKMPVHKLGSDEVLKNIEKKCDNDIAILDRKKNSSLTVKGSKLDRPKRNHSACSISWHDVKNEVKNDVDDKFDRYFEGNRLNDEEIYKTQSMPASPLRTQRCGSSLPERRKSITIPKPFKMTERYVFNFYFYIAYE